MYKNRYVILFVSVIALCVVGCKSKNKSNPVQSIERIPVEIYSAQLQELKMIVEEIAVLKSPMQVDISSEVSGSVKEIYFDEGSDVKEGDTILLIDSAIAEAKLNQALAVQKKSQANLRIADSNLMRKQTLWEKSAIPEQEFTESKEKYAVALAENAEASANLEMAQVSFEKYTLLAPFDGVISKKSVEIGAMITPGLPLFRLEKISTLYAEANIPFNRIADFQLAQSVTFAMNGMQMQGEVFRIAPVIDELTHTIKVEAKISNVQKKLLPGAFGTIKLEKIDPKQALLVPSTAVQKESTGLSYVFRVETDSAVQKAVKTAVKTGRAISGWIEIIEGIAPGDKVITLNMVNIRDGSPVIVKE